LANESLRFHGNDQSTSDSSSERIFHVRSVDNAFSSSSSLVHCIPSEAAYYIDDHVQQYWCRRPHYVNGSIIDGEYNEGK
jgi:hypothetical protein